MLLLLVLVACGTKTDADDGSSTDACEQYQPAPEIGPAVTISIRHDGTTPVFFSPHGCGGAITIDLTDATGANVPYRLDTECFPNTCDGFLEANDCSIGCNNCAPPSAGRIEAGAMTQTQWPGRVLTTLELTPACAPEGECPGSCVRPDQAPAGAYTVELTVWRTCTGTCECEPPAQEVCSLWNDEQLTDPVTFTAMLDYPTQTSVELVITD
ncbi:hypothetical protein [Paraliomyxa miuraensis]|uniref:hypothetical protein n=1 Tax=Paraliomyxa miuraensis TaxID=376150 RepID=UPI0022591C71|nr:hypothetical protein [Paraliomyxa miuraensis]MCX4243486.1 hypothetical protein [Paraliomyxa miuraensis]